MRIPSLAALTVLGACCLPCFGQTNRAPATGASPTTEPAAPVDPAESRRAHVRAEAMAWTEQNSIRYGNDADYVVKPGLLVDVKHRIVTTKAYATGIAANEAVEFFLISPTSGKSYESLAVSLAQPSDIHAGLEAIGIPAGRPVNYARMRFWPKGERVNVTFSWDERSPDGNVSRRRVRAEELLISRATNQPLAPTGLVFVGSLRVDGEDGGPKHYYADVGDPGSIASTYNEATTVLDIPAQARQSAVYQSRVVNPAYLWSPGQALEVTFEPEHPAGPRVLDVAIAEDGPELKGATYTVNGQRGLTGAAMVDWLAGSVANGREPFVTVTPGDSMTIKGVTSLFALMETLEADKGIRLEPPAPGQLFHESFSPEEAFRDYRKRTWQPVEVHFGKDGGATLVDVVENESGPERLTLKKTEVATPAELTTLLRARADQRRPLAVYAPAEMKYGDLRKWLAGGLTEDGVVWVYTE